MTRVVLLGLVLLTAACGNKTFPSLCAAQVPPPAACNTVCDPVPGSQNSCPPGYHCAAGGKCDLVCTQTGNECGDDYSCTADGFCIGNGGTSGSDVDTNCPEVHVAGAKTTPTVELLLDQSRSMTESYGNTDRWTAMRNALIAPTTGVVRNLAGSVVFGAALYSSRNANDCPLLVKEPRALNNFTAIQRMLQGADPVENTPTGASIDNIVADFAANPPATGSPPIILLATDGLPDTCTDPNPSDQNQPLANDATVAAAQRAYTAGIKLFFLFVGDADQAGTHPQRMANAGVGQDPLTGNATFYEANSPDALTAAFNTIIGNVVSCDIRLNNRVDQADAPSGVVSVNGVKLTYNTDWTLDADGFTIHVIGNACTMLKSAAAPTIDAAFPCGTIIF